MLAHSDDVAPTPGTKRRTYLQKNLGALDVTLGADDLDKLSRLPSAGSRYPDMSWVNRDTTALPS